MKENIMKEKITMSNLSLPIKIAVITANLFLLAWILDKIIWLFQPTI